MRGQLASPLDAACLSHKRMQLSQGSCVGQSHVVASSSAFAMSTSSMERSSLLAVGALRKRVVTSSQSRQCRPELPG